MRARISRRQRSYLAVLTVLCLLFQQMALAAYACPLDEVPPGSAAGPECHPDPAGPATAASPLCQKHCAPDATTGAEARTAGVPALALPPPVFPPIALRELRSSLAPARPRGEAWPPPPALASIRLLI